MTRTLTMTAGDLVASLRALVERPAVDRAVADRATAIATELGAEGVAAHVVRHGLSDYEVVATGRGLLAREFGSLASPPAPAIAPAIARAAGKMP